MLFRYLCKHVVRVTLCRHQAVICVTFCIIILDLIFCIFKRWAATNNNNRLMSLWESRTQELDAQQQCQWPVLLRHISPPPRHLRDVQSSLLCVCVCVCVFCVCVCVCACVYLCAPDIAIQPLLSRPPARGNPSSGDSAICLDQNRSDLSTMVWPQMPAH